MSTDFPSIPSNPGEPLIVQEANSPSATFQQSEELTNSCLVTKTDSQAKKIFAPSSVAYEVPWVRNLLHIQRNLSLLTHPILAAYERLVKISIQTPHEIGESLSLNLLNGTSVHFTVHKKISGRGLVAYGLKSRTDNQPNLIVFRCTRLNPIGPSGEESFPSMLSNFEREIGKSGWLATASEFDELMNDRSFREEDEQVVTLGYSLGGAHAQYFIDRFFPFVERGIFFSSVGISEATAESFRQKISESKRQTPLYFHYIRNHDDVFQGFGETFLANGENSAIVSTQFLNVSCKNCGWFYQDDGPHPRTVFSAKTEESFDSAEESEKNNPTYSSKIVEIARKIFGIVITNLSDFVLSLVHFQHTPEPPNR